MYNSGFMNHNDVRILNDSYPVVSENVYEDDFKSFYPLHDGLEWTYKVSENNRTFLQRVKCVSSEGFDQNNNYILMTESIRKSMYYISTNDSLITIDKISLKRKPIPIYFNMNYNPDYITFFLNKDVGESWIWEGNVDTPLGKKNLRVVNSYIGFEKVDLHIGSYQCLKMVTSVYNTDHMDQITSWYAKDIGLVRVVAGNYEKRIISIKN